MQLSNEVSREVLTAELELHKAEFSALREEILQLLDAERQYLNLNLVAIGATFGLITVILDNKAFVVLLLLPFVFHVLLTEMLNSIRNINHISAYLIDTLIPRVNTILDQLGDNRQGVTVLGWEIRVATRPTRTRDLVLGSITPTRQWVPILAIAASIIAYLLIVRNQGYILGEVEILLVLLNLTFLIIAAIRNAGVARTTMQQARTLLKNKIQIESELSE